MIRSCYARPVRATVLAVFFTFLAFPLPAAAQQRGIAEPRLERRAQVPAAPKAGEPRVPVEFRPDMDPDARETQQRFRELLNRYPTSLSRVLKLDPSLLTNESYLSAYPALATFLAQYPEVPHNPAYYLQWVRVTDFDPPDRQTQIYNMWDNMMEGLMIFAMTVLFVTTFAWLIKTLIDYRRWHRVSKVHTEVHTKLLDRMASNEDLLAYIQTPAGRKFLESAPIPLDAGPRAVAAPLGRILWSVQVGTVLAVGGIGLQFVSGRVLEELAQPLFVIGVLAMSLGVGFMLAAVAAFVLSRRLGLFDTQPPPSVPESQP